MGGCTVNMRVGAGKAVSGKGSVREGSVQRSRLAIHRKTGVFSCFKYGTNGATRASQIPETDHNTRTAPTSVNLTTWRSNLIFRELYKFFGVGVSYATVRVSLY